MGKEDTAGRPGDDSSNTLDTGCALGDAGSRSRNSAVDKGDSGLVGHKRGVADDTAEEGCGGPATGGTGGEAGDVNEAVWRGGEDEMDPEGGPSPCEPAGGLSPSAISGSLSGRSVPSTFEISEGVTTSQDSAFS